MTGFAYVLLVSVLLWFLLAFFGPAFSVPTFRWPWRIRGRRTFFAYFWLKHAPARVMAWLLVREFSVSDTYAVGDAEQHFEGEWPEVWADVKRWSARVRAGGGT